MTPFDTAAILVILAAAFSYLNTQTLRLPPTIGLLLAGLLASAGLLALDALLPGAGMLASARDIIGAIDFTEFLMHGIIGFLLFAGALHIDLGELLAHRLPVLLLATVGVLLSTALIGIGAYGLFRVCGMPIPFIYCLVFGALISPTDPIAVLGIMRASGASRTLETKVAGESLFNDGVGVVVFTTLLGIANAAGGHAEHAMDAANVIVLLLREVMGGLGIGLAFGAVVYAAMKPLDEPNLEVLLSLALVMAITAASLRLHASAPLACVVAGLFIGNPGRLFAMRDQTRHTLDLVWSFLDYTLNGVLFLLLGLEVVAMPVAPRVLLTAPLVVALALIARLISVAIPIGALRAVRRFSPGVIPILTWGGLRGGISVALALSLPRFPGRELLLTATYAVVIFSVVVQGLTVAPLVARYARTRP